MFRNYLKVALRNLWKSKGFSAINIIGLATGLGVCLLIVLYVADEWSYDRYNENSARMLPSRCGYLFQQYPVHGFDLAQAPGLHPRGERITRRWSKWHASVVRMTS